ncbi:MAG: peptidase [Planctomycetota bacterium]|jgi:Zn-dependent membrane protease YugP|nr:MAG: peptidase [Planctomycetota bacterium]
MGEMNPLIMLLLLVAFVLSLWAQGAVRSRFKKWSQVPLSAGLSGAQTAALVLRVSGIEGVRIERVGGRLSDHYDPRTRTLRLSEEVYSSTSVAAAGIAAHEAGHAIQHAAGYAPLALRTLAVPTAGLGSSLGFPLVLIGLFLHSFGLALLGLVLFSAVVIFQLITLPVEFDASRRAVVALERGGLITAGTSEAKGVNKVLSAAAMTYVAAALSGVAWLLHYGSVIFGGRRV